MKTRIITLSAVVLLAACGTSKMMGESDVTRGQAAYPGLTLADLQKGKADYEAKCVSCHGLKKPTSQTPEAWRKIVPGMSAGANKKAGKEVITAADQESILKYLITMSTK
jgi:cytochrome c5